MKNQNGVSLNFKATEKDYFSGHTYNRLNFGDKSSPMIFQQLIDQLLVVIEEIACYFDDTEWQEKMELIIYHFKQFCQFWEKQVYV